MPDQKKNTLVCISKKAFIRVTVLLIFFLVLTIVLTYLIPAGSFKALPDGSPDYSSYYRIEGIRGIPVWKGLLAPVLVFTSEDGLSLIILILFLMVLTAAFQVMSDVGGISALVGSVSARFRNRKFLMLSVTALCFMFFGAFLGLFEEMLTMLPIMTMLCLSLGYDSFTGFLICIAACGFGFASAITNPFTVLLASEIIGTNPMDKIWYRIIIFIVMYFLLAAFIFFYVRKIRKDPKASLTYEHDLRIRSGARFGETPELSGGKKIKRIYLVLLLGSLFLIFLCSFTVLSGVTVVILTVYFLVFGLLAGWLSCGSFKRTFAGFIKGIKSSLPGIVFIALSASVKYVFTEGGILPTIINEINKAAEEKNVYLIAVILYGIVLLLEFFISSSTAKAFMVMSLLSVLNLGLSKQMSVLIYTFADGYTNLLFPTSPVLLISLAIIEVDYFKWIRKSIPLFLINLALVFFFLFLGIRIGY